MDHWGTEIFRGTKIEKKLAEQAGVPDPFVPGVLRKTDQDLLEMLNMPQVGNMDPLAEFATNTELHMECHLAKEKGGVSLELKIGSKRRYVVKACWNYLDPAMREECTRSERQTVFHA